MNVNIMKNFSLLHVCMWSPHNWLNYPSEQKNNFQQYWQMVQHYYYLSYLQQQNFKSNEPVIVFASGMHTVFITCVKFYM